MMKPASAAAALLLGATLSASAQSVQFSTPEAAIRYRQGAFSVMAAHFSRIAMMSQGIQPYDAKSAQENAALVANLSRLPFGAFGAGTDKGAVHRAKDEVWKDAPKFKVAADRMVSEAAKLESAARSGDFDAVRSATDAVGRSCKSCHDEFRGSKRGE